MKRLFRIFSCLIVLAGLIFPTFPHAEAADKTQLSRLIWEDSLEDVELLFYGEAGLFWRSDDEKGVFRFDGSNVEWIEDIEDYPLGMVEQDGITVWSEASDEYWLHFRLYARVDGDRKMLASSMKQPAEQINIDYPYVTWTEYCNENSPCRKVTYDLETGKKTEDSLYRYDPYEGVYKKGHHDQFTWLRPFESFPVDGYEYRDWTMTDEYVLWQEPSGVYLDRATDEGTVYRRISDHVVDDRKKLTGKEDYVVWQEGDEEIGVYSLEENQSYFVPADLDNVKGIMVHAGQMAVLHEDLDSAWIELFDIDTLLEETREEGVKGVAPSLIKPKLVKQVLAQSPSERTDQIAVSADYIAWIDTDLYYRHKNKEEIFSLEGSWSSAAFLENDLYVIRDHSFEEDEEENELYKIDPKTGERNVVYRFDGWWAPDKLIAQNGYLYWAEESKLVRYSPKDGSTKELPIEDNYVNEWAVADDQWVWVVRSDDKYVLKLQTGKDEARKIAEWSDRKTDLNGLAFDGKQIVWGIDKNEKTSEIHLYDLEKGKETVVYKGKDRPNRGPLLLADDTIYFLGGEKRDGFQIISYDIEKKRKGVAASNVWDFTMSGNDLIYLTQSPRSKTYYMLQKKADKRFAVDLNYKWKDVEKNNGRLWNNVRYSFYADDIEITVGSKNYTWADFIYDQEKWREFLRKNRDKMTIRVRL
jgi:hypothetical protein